MMYLGVVMLNNLITNKKYKEAIKFVKDHNHKDDLNLQCEEDEFETPIFKAIEAGQFELVIALIEAGVPLDQKTPPNNLFFISLWIYSLLITGKM